MYRVLQGTYDNKAARKDVEAGLVLLEKQSNNHLQFPQVNVNILVFSRVRVFLPS